jgi:Xaa-Pro aminopeptidase
MHESDAGAAPRRREIDGKVEAVQRAMREAGVARALLRSRANFAWLTAGGDNHVDAGSEEGVAGVVIGRDGLRVLTTVIEEPRIRDEELAGLGIEIEAIPWETELEEAMALSGRFADDDALDDALLPLRQVLNEREQDELVVLGRDVAAALTDAMLRTSAGDTEADVEARVRSDLALRGVRVPVFLAAADERNVRYRHPIPKANRVTESLMVVVVGERRGLNAAITRMAWFRQPSAEERRRYAAIWDVYEGFAAGTKPGVTLAEALLAGTEAYGRAGFPDEWQHHHQGGTIGYASREIVAKRSATTRIVPGMAFAWNPSLPAAKAEDTFILTEHGPRFVTRDPRWPADDRGRPDILVRVPGSAAEREAP